MIVTSAQQEVIHTILERMLTGVSGRAGYLFLYEGNRELGIAEDEGKFLRAVMAQEGLVINHDGPNKNNLSELTAKGRSIAQAPGGYRGYIEAQQKDLKQQKQNAEEDRRLARISALSTQDAADSARISTKWARISGLAAIVAIVVSVIITLDQQADNSASDKRVEALEQKIKTLEQRLAALPSTGTMSTPLEASRRTQAAK